MQKELIILGAGESGIGAAILAKKLNMPVFVTDFSEINTTCKTALNAHQIEWEENGHSTERILKAQEIVKSPGVPDKAKIVQQARSQGISIISEIEFASRHTPTRIIAITGSNGKTTTTMLTNHLLQSAGITTRMGGNIGYSFARLVAQEMEENLPKDAVYVLEISSFQLDDIQTFHPYISMLLNITPEDRKSVV